MFRVLFAIFAIFRDFLVIFRSRSRFARAHYARARSRIARREKYSCAGTKIAKIQACKQRAITWPRFKDNWFLFDFVLVLLMVTENLLLPTIQAPRNTQNPYWI